MQLFHKLFQRVMAWSRHRHAPWYLAGLSFAESSFFPIPPDVMLVPMTMAKPRRAWHFALLTTCFSVLGGLLGYLLGYCFFALIHPYLVHVGYMDYYHDAAHWFATWGFWAVMIAGFTPIPYKVFTIAAGSLHMAVLPFIFASILGRGGRFFLIALLMYFGGERIERFLLHTIDRIAWFTIALIVIGLILWKFFQWHWL